jgi:uncharacterized protein with NAD-binding domain and iron-sulfur cluster
MAKVVIIGGGVAGLSAAHELIERGFEVDIYESNPEYVGGKARSVNVPGTNQLHPDKFLPGEHGFRFFPGFYRHVTDTMQRIPLSGKNGKNSGKKVFSNLVPTRAVMVARYGLPSIIVNAGLPNTGVNMKQQLKGLKGSVDTGLTKEEKKFFLERMLQLATSCRVRRDNDYEKIGWWEFMHADEFSATYRSLIVVGLTRTLVAANAKSASTKTGGSIVLQLIYCGLQPWVNTDRVLNGPTNDVWLNPWKEYLTRKGVQYMHDAHAVQINLKDHLIDNVTIKTNLSNPEKARDIDVNGDYYIFACPIERMAELVSDELIENDLCFQYLKELAPSVAWMNGIQFYLNQNIEINQGHIIFSDSEWALTTISQVQFWGDYDLDMRFNGKVKGVLSVDISDWLSTKYKDVLAEECRADEVADYVWEQIEKSLNVDGKIIVERSMIEFYYLDRDIHWDDKIKRNIDKEPLLVNSINTWGLRPTASTDINNMFLAADYVRTNTDLATMEGANEAARRAVNCIIDAEGNRSSYAQIFEFNDPWFFDVMKWWDRRRYDKGLPYSSKFPWWVKGVSILMGLFFVIDGIFKYLFYKLRITGEAGYIILSMVVTLGFAALDAWKGWGTWSAFALSIGMYIALSIYAFRLQDRFLKKLLLFGLVVGLVELLADNWLVNGIRVLVYPSDEPFLWASPMYMPIAWAVVLIQVGYLGYLISKSRGLVVGSVATFMIGLIFIPVFEFAAKYAGWWEYIPTKNMFMHTPYFIILGEGLICMILPFIFVKEWRLKWWYSILFGLFVGFWIFLSYFTAYNITG